MSRANFIFRLGLWLAFLTGALALPLVYLVNAPTPVGSGLLYVFAWGALAGTFVGLAVQFLYEPLLPPRGRLNRLKYILGAIALGAFGGAGAAALIDGHDVKSLGTVELPLVSIEQSPSRRGRRAQITTLEPLNPTREKSISLRHLTREGVEWVEPGMCLYAELERGLLGGTWISNLKAGRCSPIRGRPSTHVLALDDFSNWSWHSPQRAASREGPSFIDAALPPEFRCQTRPGAWLYRCEVPSGGPHSKGVCWQRPRHWRHIDPQSFLTGIEGLLFYEIEVRPDGSLTFNSDEVDVAGLQELLATTEQLTPPPPLVLRTTANSDCRKAEQVRAMLDGRPLCRMGNCFESSRWQELGLPTFKAHVNRFAHIEGARR